VPACLSVSSCVHPLVRSHVAVPFCGCPCSRSSCRRVLGARCCRSLTGIYRCLLPVLLCHSPYGLVGHVWRLCILWFLFALQGGEVGVFVVIRGRWCGLVNVSFIPFPTRIYSFSCRVVWRLDNCLCRTLRCRVRMPHTRCVLAYRCAPRWCVAALPLRGLPRSGVNAARTACCLFQRREHAHWFA